MKGAVCVIRPIPAREYVDYLEETIAIFEDYSHLMDLETYLEREAPGFDLPHLYAALKTLFGESATLYDDYKCSFGFPFLLEITRKEKISKYLLNFMDLKGGLNFRFTKILTTPEEREKYPDKVRDILYKPLADDFPKEEMRYVMNFFLSYLVGFMEAYGKIYNEPFIRSQDYRWIIYGFKDGRFFVDRYEDYDEFRAAQSDLMKSEVIPFNRVKPNP